MQNNSLISSSWTEKKWVQWTRFSLFLLLSFSIPVLLGVLVLKQNGFYPFDSNGITIISIDFQSQYISYLRYYRKLLIENGSLIYTTSKTFGGDFLSISLTNLAQFLTILFKSSKIASGISSIIFSNSLFSSLKESNKLN